MQKEDCFQLGHISRKHGYKGEVIAVFDTDRNEAYKDLGSILVEINHELIPFFIEEISMNSKGHFILQLEDVASDEDASKLINHKLYLPLSSLPKPTGKDFYYHELEGFDVYDEHYGYLGKCSSVMERPPQPILIIKKSDKEILIPAVDEIILSLDREKREIHLSTPEGLIDIYLEDEKS